MKKRQVSILIFLLSVLITMINGVYATEEDIVDGVDWGIKVQSSNADKYTSLTGESVDSFWEYPLDGFESIKWLSKIVPESLKNKRVRFIVASGMGTNMGDKGFHELFINGKKILEINTVYGTTINWNSELASASFETLFVDENKDIFGIFSVTVAPELIEFGKRQNFEMKGKRCLSKSWFSISKVENLATFNVKELQAERKIDARIAKIKTDIKTMPLAKPPLSDQICKWYWNKSCAVALGNDNTILPTMDNLLIFKANGKKMPSDADDIVNTAVNERKWLIELYPESLLKSPDDNYKKHLEYLSKLDCLIWKDSVEKIKNYAEMAKDAKIAKDDDGKGLIKVSLSGFPEGFKSEQALTVILMLPTQTWKAEAFCEEKLIPSEYIVFGETRGIKFDIFPGGKCAYIHYTK